MMLETALNTAPHIFPIKISEIYVNTQRIFPSLAVSGSCGDKNLHYLVDIVLPHLVVPI